MYIVNIYVNIKVRVKIQDFICGIIEKMCINNGSNVTFRETEMFIKKEGSGDCVPKRNNNEI